VKTSIKTQIIVAVLVSQLLLALVLTLAVVLYSRYQLLAGFDIMLEGRADSVLAAIHEPEDGNQNLILDRSRLNFPGRDLVEVWDDAGNLVWRSRNWQGTPAAVMASASARFELTQGPFSYRGIVLRKATIFDDDEPQSPASLRKVTIIYAASTRELNRRIFKIGLFAAGLSFLLVSLAGLFAAHGVRKGLEPVQELALEASRVSARNWSFTSPHTARERQELAPLAEALDATLARLHLAFERERKFIADAAHELKTSVAILKSSLQLLICQPRSTSDYRAGIEHSLEDCARVEAVVCSTLTLASAEAQGDQGPREPLTALDVVRNCQQAMADVTPLSQSRGISLRCISHNSPMVKADPISLHTVWVNLLQNAIQHSPEGSTVTLEVVASGPDTVSVIVEDSGVGIPSEELPYVFDRFWRGDPSRSRSTGGFGLGLSICRAIVESYDGRIEIASGAGTRVLVSLPVMPIVFDENLTS